ncbi:MAG: hypothetical protein MRY83_23580, partial [Flavobacteriales bacterium]|nr:hypothetical protein [Flavobacteriales bacterium]
MNYLIYIPFALFLFACGSNPNQNDQLSKDDLDALIEQELKNEQRAKFGGGNYSFETITDPPKVAELNKKILIEQKKSKALQNSQSNQSLGDKYKSGDQSVVPEIIQILKGNDVDKKRTLYFDLQRSYDDPIEYQITNEKIIKTVFENLKKKEDQANAIQLAGYMKLQGYIKQFENLLESADAENKNRLLYWLSEEGSSTLPLDYIIEKIQTKKIDLVKDYNAIDVLGSYSENGTANNQKRAIDACIKIYNDKLIPSSKFEETKSYWSSDNPANALIDVLLESSDPGVVAIANDLIKKDIAVGQATLFLCKLEGKTHQEKALAL